MPKLNRQRIINASEVAEYEFCAKAWHLRRVGETPQNPRIAEGEDYHKQHEGELLYVSRLRQAAIFCFLAAVFLILGLMLFRILFKR